MAARHMLWEHDKQNGITVLDWEEWSDSCAEQFRCVGGIMDFTEALKSDCVRSVKNFFYRPYHRKAEGDGAGVWLKCTCQMASIHGEEYLPDAEHVHRFMDQQKYKEPEYSSYKSVNEKRTVNETVFFHLTQADVDKVKKLNGKTMDCGIKKTDCYRLHSKSLEVHTCRRPCACESCRSHSAGEQPSITGCKRKRYMEGWQSEKMVPRDERTEYATRRSKNEMLELQATQVEADAVIAVEHSDKDLAEEYDYFLLRATKPGYVVPAAITDDYGAEFVPGDIVVEVQRRPRTMQADCLWCRAISSRTQTTATISS